MNSDFNLVTGQVVGGVGGLDLLIWYVQDQ